MEILTAEDSRLRPLELFELTTRQFCCEAKHLPLLCKALKAFLGCSGLDIVAIGSMFGHRERLWRYVAVCYMLCEVLSPLPETDPETLIGILMQRYVLAQDCVHKAIQCLTEWNFPAKHLLEQFDPVQNDPTQESFKVQMLFQVSELAQHAIYSKMVTQGAEAGAYIEDQSHLQQFESMVTAIESIHEIKLETTCTEFGFQLPY